MANGQKVEVDPAAWAIVDGRLYLNFSHQALAEWKRNSAGNIERANRNWPALHNPG